MARILFTCSANVVFYYMSGKAVLEFGQRGIPYSLVQVLQQGDLQFVEQLVRAQGSSVLHSASRILAYAEQ